MIFPKWIFLAGGVLLAFSACLFFGGRLIKSWRNLKTTKDNQGVSALAFDLFFTLVFFNTAFYLLISDFIMLLPLSYLGSAVIALLVAQSLRAINRN